MPRTITNFSKTIIIEYSHLFLVEEKSDTVFLGAIWQYILNALQYCHLLTIIPIRKLSFGSNQNNIQVFKYEYKHRALFISWKEPKCLALK